MRHFLRSILLLATFASSSLGLSAQTLRESSTVAGKLVVVYRGASVPVDADRIVSGTRSHAHFRHLGMSVVDVLPGTEAQQAVMLSRQPEVFMVLHDRMVQGHMPKQIAPVKTQQSDVVISTPTRPVSGLPVIRSGLLPSIDPVTDAGYRSPAGWAVKSAGGYGSSLAGSASVGPWSFGLGAGMRIAILDSGLDANHPDLAPNLALNLSEIDRTALPSACDDGSPQDQQGHGTWAASLAAGALGAGTGDVVGVAPQATLLNIKVLERMPGAGSTPLAQCEAGQPSGLLSWVLAGINDAVEQHADVISLSLGSLVDISTGDGAGWKASFDRATYAAEQAGIIVIAAAGNDGLDLSSGHLVELPAQSRGVLAVTASTNPACAENIVTGAGCAPGSITRAYYSNYGATLNAIAAPGGSYPEGPDAAVSGWIRGACSSGLTNTADGLPANGASFGCFGLGHAQYVQAMGTSASAPLVAGAAALLRAARRDLSADQVVALLRSSATRVPTMAEPELNLGAALGLQ